MAPGIRALTAPFDIQIARGLRAGDQVLLSGVIYTARDAAHKRLYELLQQGKPLPLDLRGQTLYYTGPTPAKTGHALGSAGPTTSARMDIYAPHIIEHAGLRAMIGKGNRNNEVIQAMQTCGCVYFAAPGGLGALLAKTIQKADCVCYQDLGPEAIYRLEIKQMPLIVAIDCEGGTLFRKVH